MRRFLRENGLTLFFVLLLLMTIVGQAFVGQAELRNAREAESLPAPGLGAYVTSSDFAVDVAENWQSEYLQFFLFIYVTVWLTQRGSPESKPVEDSGIESDEKQLVGEHATSRSPQWAAVGGWRTAIFSRSLGTVMAIIFVWSWLAQSLAGVVSYNEERLTQQMDPVSWRTYVGSAEFWSRTLQNWQSEFLAVASMAALSIYLRQRGSPESKPVGAPHESATGEEG